MCLLLQDFSPRIFISDSDFIAITNNGALCNINGHLGALEFENVMREQILNYTQSRMSAASEFWSVSDQDFTELGTLKQILVEQLCIKKQQEKTMLELNRVMSHLESAKSITRVASASSYPRLGVEEFLCQLGCDLKTSFRSDQVGLNQEISCKIEHLKTDLKALIANSAYTLKSGRSMLCPDDYDPGNVDISGQQLSISSHCVCNWNRPGNLGMPGQPSRISPHSLLNLNDPGNLDAPGQQSSISPHGSFNLTVSNFASSSSHESVSLANSLPDSKARIEKVSPSLLSSTADLLESSHNPGKIDSNINGLHSVIISNNMQRSFKTEEIPAKNNRKDLIDSKSFKFPQNLEMNEIIFIPPVAICDSKSGTNTLETNLCLDQANIASLEIEQYQPQIKQDNLFDVSELEQVLEKGCA